MSRSLRTCSLVVVLGCGGGSGENPPDPPDGISEPAPLQLTLRDPDGGTSNASFVAVRDGDGLWVEVPTNGAGVYTARVTSNRYGWWIGCARSTFSTNRVLYRHLDEGLELERASCESRVLPLEISGTIAGVAQDESTEIYSLSGFDSPADNTSYSVGAEAGPAQLLASRLDTDFNAASVIRADLGTISASTTHDLDFAQQAQPVVRVPVEITGGEADFAFDTFTGIYVDGAGMYLPLEITTAPPVNLLALPETMRQAGDMLEVSVFARREIGGGLADQRGVGSIGAELPETLALPPATSFGDATVTETPFSISWTLPQLATDAVVSAFWFADSTGTPLLTTIDASARWAADSTTLDLAPPEDLTLALVQSPNPFAWTIDAIVGDVRASWTSAGSAGQTPIEKPVRRARLGAMRARVP